MHTARRDLNEEESFSVVNRAENSLKVCAVVLGGMYSIAVPTCYNRFITAFPMMHTPFCLSIIRSMV